MENKIETIVNEVLTSLNKEANGASSCRSTNSQSGTKVSSQDYPLSEKRQDLVRTPTNKTLDDITLNAVLNGQIDAKDLRITPETLELQAQIAESVGRKAFAVNLRRAAELTRIPDERILEIYNALRPNRSTKQELLDIAKELKEKYQASITSTFVAEAAEVYERRNVLLK